MNSLLTAFLNNLLPILLASGVGFFLGKKTSLSPAPLSKVVLYIFSPCLVFNLLTTSPLTGGETLMMMGFSAATMTAITLLAGGVGYLMRWNRSLIAATMLASLATNAGNYGLSLTSFAFGQPALPYATLYMISNSLLTYTLGITIVSWGSERRQNPLSAPFKYPFLYAFILAILFNIFHIQLPLPIGRVVTLFSDAAIPTMLVILGLQLSCCQWKKPDLALLTSNVMRLVASPLVAIALASVFALQGAARQAGVIEAAMPTAVTATILAAEFNLEPNFITFTVAFSTLLSFVTLTPLITYLS